MRGEKFGYDDKKVIDWDVVMQIPFFFFYTQFSEKLNYALVLK